MSRGLLRHLSTIALVSSLPLYCQVWKGLGGVGVNALPFRSSNRLKSDETEDRNKRSAVDEENDVLDFAFVDTKGGNVVEWSSSEGSSWSESGSPLPDDTPRPNGVLVDRFFQSLSLSVPGPMSNHSSESLAMLEEVRRVARQMSDFLRRTRRLLHRQPELMFQEKMTSQLISSLLTQWNITHSRGWAVNTHPEAHKGPGGFGVVADVGSGGAPCVLLRADMDALPILERTAGIDDFISRQPNVMHACGHDAHTTMLLGAAYILKQFEPFLPGTVRIVFQPAEEGGAGAKRMIEEGLLSIPQPQLAFAMHVWPTLPTGVIASRKGPLLAACERFEIVVAGVGGHAAMPHLTVDPIVAASAIVMNLQTIVSRTISPLDAGVCSITHFDAGTGSFNVIPHAAVLKGTIRSLSTENLLELRNRVQHIVETTANTHRCNVSITYSPDYYPVTTNDPTLFDSFSRNVGHLVATHNSDLRTDQQTNNPFQDLDYPTMGAEDFSFIAQAIPSTFFLLGQGSGTNPPTHYGLHHPHFALDESVLPLGVQLHVNLALRAIAHLQHNQHQLN